MRLTALFFSLISCAASFAQGTDSVFLYRRASICSILVNHRALEFSDDIGKAFNAMPVPDKYNDHDLGKKVFYTMENKLKIDDIKSHKGFIVNSASDKNKMNDFDKLLEKQFVASRLLAKWFDRKKNTGICDMRLIQERGYNNASEVDKRLAALSVRKDALLRDAGEELIGSTFVLVNDIRYIDRHRGAMALSGALDAVTSVGSMASGSVPNMSNSGLSSLIETYKSFNVKIKSYLYQLVWDEPTMTFFYNDVYTEIPDKEKKMTFESNRGRFSLKFLGMQESSGSRTSFIGIKDDEPDKMVRKACQRALDENVASLQKNFDVFKVKTPLLSVNPIKCEIGKKEGITEDSRYEVLEAVEDESGHVSYKRIGIIRPVKDKIWDNRYMAAEEKAEGAGLGYTTFTKVSGGIFCPGMLVREL